MKVGLLFGSFNPVHTGHMILANYLASSTDLSAVWFVVSPQNPLKPSKSLLNEYDRLHMVSLAIDNNPLLHFTDIEFKMPRPSYTIDTLTYLQEKYPSYQFVLIMGEDNLGSFPKWKNYERILDFHEVYVYPRSQSAHSQLKEHPKVQVITAPWLDLSATFIRDAIRAGRSIRYMVPDSVAQYITLKKLYL